MIKFSESLREHAMKIINFKKKNFKLLTNEQQKSYENAKICYIWKETFEDTHAKDKIYRKLRDHCQYTGEYSDAANSLCNLKYSVPKEIATFFHNGSNYDYHFIIKELAEEFEGQFNCLAKNIEKYITFSVPTEKELQVLIKKGKEIRKTVSYRLQFIDSSRFMESSLSNLVNNLAKEIHKIQCKYRHNDNKCENCAIEYKDYECFLQYRNFKDDLIECKCLCYNKNY